MRHHLDTGGHFLLDLGEVEHGWEPGSKLRLYHETPPGECEICDGELGPTFCPGCRAQQQIDISQALVELRAAVERERAWGLYWRAMYRLELLTDPSIEGVHYHTPQWKAARAAADQALAALTALGGTP